MTVATQDAAKTADKKSLTSFLLAFVELPPKKKDRVRKLAELMMQADSRGELLEIAGAIAEIIVPAMANIRKSVPVDMEEGVDARDRETVEAYYRDLGRRIREIREQKKLTQLELAKKSRLPQSHISRLEAGLHAPTPKTIERIAAALKVPPSEIDLLYEKDGN